MLKRIKRLLKLRNNSGFTMVEVIVSVALLGILVLGVLGFMAPVLASVAEKQQNARATMLAEAIDSFISSNVQNAKYVKVFSNVTPDNSYDKITDDGNFQVMRNVDSNHVFQCIAFQWMPTGVYDQYKLVMRFNPDATLASNQASFNSGFINVFGDSIYDGLNLIPIIEPIDNQYQAPDAGGTMVDQVPADEVHNIGLRVNTKMYANRDCYRTNESVAKAAQLAFSGESFNRCTPIASPLTNPKTAGGYSLEIYPNTEYVYDYSPSSSLVQTEEDGNNYYYPETYIFFVRRKLV